MVTVYNNGTEYTIIKSIHNGCEYCFGGGPKTGYVDVLVVGGGGGGGCGGSYGGGGGGGGQVREIYGFPITDICLNVVVGGGGTMRNDGSNSCIGEIIACGGGSVWAEGGATSGSGCPGGAFVKVTVGNSGGGGGGAGGAGCASNCGSNGGKGVCSDITGSSQAYGGGGGGGFQSSSPGACGCDGGGDGGGRCCVGCNATGYGGGGGGGGYYCSGGTGCQGVVIIRYKTDGSCGICNTSFGGCKYTCGDYTIHCFTNTGTTEQFIPVYK